MKDVMKIATVNFKAEWGEKDKNLNRILGYIEQAALDNCNLVVFPEMALTGYDDEEDKEKHEKMQTLQAETIPGPSSDKVAELTKKYGIYVAFGMPERDPADASTIYNSACVCGPEGVIGGYRKIHLPYPEMHWATRGEKPFIFDTPWGPVGLAICYDSYCFPELGRYYAAKGCRVYINCTAYARCHGDMLARSTMEAYAGINKYFIVSSNLVGIDLYNDFWGGSSIIGPGIGWNVSKGDIQYYAGHPFGTPESVEHGMYTAVCDLGLATRSVFEPNKLINGATDYRPLIYKELLEDLLKDPKFHKTEFGE